MNNGDGVDYVARDRTVKWYRVTDQSGTEYRWKMIGDERGATQFVCPDRGAVSPVLWGIGAVRGWLLANGLTPSGSKSPEWSKHLAERRERRQPAA